MYYSLIDAFQQTVGSSLSSITEAEDKVEEMGEAAGEFTVIETRESLEDNTEINNLPDGSIIRRWQYDFFHEKLVEEKL